MKKLKAWLERFPIVKKFELLLKRYLALRIMSIIFLCVCGAGFLIKIVSPGVPLFVILIFIIALAFPMIITAVILGGVGGVIFTGAKQIKSYREVMSDETLKALEKERIAVQLLNLVFWVAAIGFVFFIPVIIIPAGAIVYFSYIRPMNRKYSNNFKQTIVKGSLEKYLQNVSYKPDEFIKLEEIHADLIFKDITDIKGNDLIEADYRDIHFTQSDLSLAQVTYIDSDEARSRTQAFVMFKGRLMKFRFPKEFAGSVQVLSKNFKNAANVNVSDAQTELDQFNQQFKICTINNEDAFRVLNPQMIEGIARLGEQIKDPMAFTFSSNEMYVFISMIEDSFEATVMGDITITEEQKKVRQELKFILTFLDNMYYKAS